MLTQTESVGQQIVELGKENRSTGRNLCCAPRVRKEEGRATQGMLLYNMCHNVRVVERETMKQGTHIAPGNPCRTPPRRTSRHSLHMYMSMCMYMCMHVRMRVYLYVCICAYVYMSKCLCADTPECVSVCICICVGTYVFACICVHLLVLVCASRSARVATPPSKRHPRVQAAGSGCAGRIVLVCVCMRVDICICTCI